MSTGSAAAAVRMPCLLPRVFKLFWAFLKGVSEGQGYIGRGVKLGILMFEGRPGCDIKARSGGVAL